jgi:hypothetical protein
MTVKWVDGFDLYAAGVHGDQMATRYSSVPGFPSFVTGRFGGRACEGANGLECFPFGSAVSTLTVGFAYKADGLGSTGQICRLRNSGSDICDLSAGAGGALRLTRAGTQLGITATGIVAINTWSYVELEFTRSATVGVFNLWVNGVRLLNLTGQNTGASDIDSVRFEHQNDLTLDDLYITDTAARLGECRVDTLRPSADTATKDWTASTGTDNYAMVDDAQIDTTDYVQGITAGNKDYYALADLSFNPNNIYAVNAIAFVKKDDATTRTYRTNIKSSSTEGHGATRGLTSSFVLYSDIFETDPNGSAAWTQSAVNALTAGPEVVS